MLPNRRSADFDVLVVGAGPGGLAAAVTLGSYGVRTLVIERRLSASTMPRATVATIATMELLRRWGLEAAAWDRSIDVEWRAWSCVTLAAADEGEAIEVGLPTRDEARLVSPTSPAALPQDELEPLLEEHLSSFSTVRVERGVELVSLAGDGKGGHVVTLSGPGGRRRRMRVTYVIGADGLRSTVRRERGIASNGSEGLAKRIGFQFRAPLWNLVGENRYGIYFLPGERSFLPAGRPDRWGFAMAWEGSQEKADALAEHEVKAWIRDAAGDPELPITLERSMLVSFGVGLAERFRDGGVFLIGDAAHRVTPRGGTGLNMAVRDGFDIGWKLAWVLRGWGGDPLLESYERERRPVAAFNTQRSTRSDGSVLGTHFGLAPDIGGRIAHAWVPRDEELLSTLDLLGDGLTLFAGPAWNGEVPHGDAGSPPIAVERLDAIAARSLGLMASGSLLARPDGHPVALWNDESPDASRLKRAVAAATGAERPAHRPRNERFAPRSHVDAALATAVARGGIIRR